MSIFKKRPSPAMIVALAALSVSLAGTAVAGPIAEISLNKGEKKQIRKMTRNISGKVSNRRITKRAPGLNVASARNAVIANVANASNSAINATNAKNAENAENADSAANSDQVGGVGIGDIVQKTAQSGETLTGQIATHYEANEKANPFFLVGGSYRSPLPSGVAAPTLVYTEGTTAQCPGFGRAAAGVLCVYAYRTGNIDSVGKSSGFDDENKRYGFSLDVFLEVPTENGWMIASWAYQVP